MERVMRKALESSLVAALVAGGVLVATRQAPPVSGDAARDFLLARDCVELGRCHAVGASASALSLYHGPLWPDVIALVELAR
jgi:hypothetical protein